MANTKDKSKYTNEYKKQHYKAFRFEISKEYYEKFLLPALDESGETANGYIRKALEARINNETEDTIIEVPLRIYNKYYEDVVIPYAKEQNLSCNEFINKCIEHAINFKVKF